MRTLFADFGGASGSEREYWISANVPTYLFEVQEDLASDGQTCEYMQLLDQILNGIRPGRT